jgi:hypothetical protein
MEKKYVVQKWHMNLLFPFRKYKFGNGFLGFLNVNKFKLRARILSEGVESVDVTTSCMCRIGIVLRVR